MSTPKKPTSKSLNKTTTKESTASNKEAKGSEASDVETSPEVSAAAKSGTKPKKQGSTKGASKGSGPNRAPLISGTFFAKNGQVSSEWKLINAAGVPLGRLSTHVAHLLMGKHKPKYTRHSDTGDHVIVINAKDVVLTGNKWAQKTYNYHTGYAGGIKTLYAATLLETKPEFIIEKAVGRMLPKGHMGRKWFSKLKVYKEAEHPHGAQKPTEVKLPNIGNRES